MMYEEDNLIMCRPPSPAVLKTAVGTAYNQNKVVFLSLPACLRVSLVVLQQNKYL